MSKRKHNSDDPADWARWRDEGRASTGKSPYPPGSMADFCFLIGQYGRQDSRLRDEAVAAAEREGARRLRQKQKEMGLEPV